MYFIHSYILQPSDSSHTLSTTLYGGLRFPSTIGKGKIIGCQFHPEKSAREGLRIIENFVRMAH
ncbi:MAG: imidazole glycerol phosphate synthase subunit HisH, partial [Patescibacteria group bacterium]